MPIERAGAGYGTAAWRIAFATAAGDNGPPAGASTVRARTIPAWLPDAVPGFARGRGGALLF